MVRVVSEIRSGTASLTLSTDLIVQLAIKRIHTEVPESIGLQEDSIVNANGRFLAGIVKRGEQHMLQHSSPSDLYRKLTQSQHKE